MPLPRQGYLWFFVRDNLILTKLAVVYGASPEAIRQRRDPPTQSDWAYGELTDSSVALRFELGVDLPYSRESFGRALALPTNYGWSSLREQLVPPGAEGRFGGYAFGHEGQHYVQGVGLIHLGRHGLIFPYSYESVRELDEALASGPRWRVENQEQLDKWRAENKALRPDVEWIERHRSEIDEWRLLCRIRSLLNVSLEWGGAADSLWVFIRASDLAAGNFENVFAAIAP